MHAELAARRDPKGSGAALRCTFWCSPANCDAEAWVASMCQQMFGCYLSAFARAQRTRDDHDQANESAACPCCRCKFISPNVNASTVLQTNSSTSYLPLGFE